MNMNGFEYISKDHNAQATSDATLWWFIHPVVAFSSPTWTATPSWLLCAGYGPHP